MKKVAILGFGVEGRAAWAYFSRLGADITILNELPITDVPAGVKVEIGSEIFTRAKGYDVVVRTPSIHPNRIVTDGKITSATKEFFAHCPAPIIGVTGSKGKGTTASWIRLMLQNAGKKTFLVGNIGVPALAMLDQITKDDMVVYELSSFQLWDLTQSPQVAVILMIEPEHLDVHISFEEYVAAKANIVAYQTSKDKVIFLPSNQYSATIAAKSLGDKIPYTTSPGAYVEDNYIIIDNQKIIATSEVALPGQHNLENACAAVTAAWQMTQNHEAIAKALRDFKGLEHRLKFIKEVDGVRYYDDSIATTPGAAIAALQAFTQPKIIILGGSSKGAQYNELAKVMASQSVKKALLIGDERFKIQQALDEVGFTAYELLDKTVSMQKIVAKAHTIAAPGDVVLLSPACASFGMFKSYTDRGNQFINAVNDI